MLIYKSKLIFGECPSAMQYIYFYTQNIFQDSIKKLQTGGVAGGGHGRSYIEAGEALASPVLKPYFKWLS